MSTDTPLARFEASLRARADKLAAALPKHVTPDRFIRCALNLVSVNSDWLNATKYDQASLYMSLMNAAQTGLEPDPQLGHLYIVPRYNRKLGKLAFQCQIGYRGMIRLAYQSGRVLDVGAGIVRQGDEFEWLEGTDSFVKHKRLAALDKPITHGFAYVKLQGGAQAVKVMPIEDINAIRDICSDAADKDFSPWKRFYEAMAQKTVLRPMLKLKPISLELSRAISLDEAAEIQNDRDASVSAPELLKQRALAHNPLKPVSATIEPEAVPAVIDAPGQESLEFDGEIPE